MNKHKLSYVMPVDLMLTGKFQAEDDHWIHLDRILQDYELIVMKEGIFHFQVDFVKYTVKKGEYLLLPPGSHTFGYQESYCSFYWMHFMPRTFSGQINESEKTISGKILYGNALAATTLNYPLVYHEHGTIKNSERLILLLKQLHDMMRTYNNSNLNDYFATASLLELYNQIQKSSEEESNKENHHKKEAIINDIIDYIKWHLNENIKVSEIAAHFSYNEKYLSHLFSTVSGSSLKQFIMKEKIENAKFQLIETTEPIKGIAFMLGYNDSHHFMKTFKKLVGITPTEFRNTYSKRLIYYK